MTAQAVQLLFNWNCPQLLRLSRPTALLYGPW